MSFEKVTDSLVCAVTEIGIRAARAVTATPQNPLITRSSTRLTVYFLTAVQVPSPDSAPLNSTVPVILVADSMVPV
jgi:hypothetical protein